jgi:hypothetical protein
MIVAPFPQRPRSLLRRCVCRVAQAALILSFVCALSGCASEPDSALAPSQIRRQEPWTNGDLTGSAIVTRHYVIYTTVTDQHLLESLALVMEGALQQYQETAPGVPVSNRLMECYVFADRQQWAQFTREKTGDDASLYLRITRGGYTVGDWYVAYYIGDAGTLSVAAHEGFHQFAARNFKMRVPPFLEEGLASMFENVQWDHGRPIWDLENNPNRLSSLRMGASAGKLMPLEELAGMHAGQVVNGPAAGISAFYGESWAFARFLLSQENRKYRPRLQRLLADAAAGRLEGVIARPTDAVFWHPASAKPLLERYLQVDLKTLDGEFLAYLEELLNESVELK